MTPQFKTRIADYFSTGENKYFRGTPNKEESIRQTEQELGIKFDAAYKYLLLHYGGAYVGIDLLSCEGDPAVKAPETVESITQSFRSDYLKFGVCEELQQSYVISIDGSGDPIFIAPDGKVKIYFHDSNDVQTLAENLESLILKNL